MYRIIPLAKTTIKLQSPSTILSHTVIAAHLTPGDQDPDETLIVRSEPLKGMVETTGKVGAGIFAGLHCG